MKKLNSTEVKMAKVVACKSSDGTVKLLARAPQRDKAVAVSTNIVWKEANPVIQRPATSYEEEQVRFLLLLA